MAPSPRRERRPGAVAGVVIVVAAVGVIAAAVAFAGGGGTSEASSTPSAGGFPSPKAVPTSTSSPPPVRLGRATAWALPVVLAAPRDVLVGADGRVWVTEQNKADVDAFENGSFVHYSMDAFPNGGAYQLAAGPGDTVWFSGFPGGSVGRVLPEGTANLFSALATSSATLGITQGPDGTMWLADEGLGGVFGIRRDGSIATVAIPAEGSTAPKPRDIATAPDGSLWFTDPGRGALGTFSADGKDVREYRVGSPEPRSVAVASDGSVWATLGDRKAIVVLDPTDGGVRRIQVPQADGDLNDLAFAADGSVWVTEQGALVLHLSADGTFLDAVRMPGKATYADGISIAADGTVWVAATDANTIVSIAPQG